MKKSRKIRILLADDNSALRSALALLLETRLNANIVGESYSMENLLANLPVSRPDIVILDWELPGTPKDNRIDFLHKIYPDLKVVVIGSQPEIVQTIAGRACRCLYQQIGTTRTNGAGFAGNLNLARARGKRRRCRPPG